MPLNSFNFWLIFPIIFGIYWLIPAKYNSSRKWFLILVSYLLYMNWKPAFAVVLLLVTLITYRGGVFTWLSARYKEKKDACLALCVAWASASSLIQVLQFLKRVNNTRIITNRITFFTARTELGDTCRN